MKKLCAIRKMLKKNIGPSRLSYCIVRPSIVAPTNDIKIRPGNYIMSDKYHSYEVDIGRIGQKDEDEKRCKKCQGHVESAVNCLLGVLGPTVLAPSTAKKGSLEKSKL